MEIKKCRACGKPLSIKTDYLAEIKKYCDSKCASDWHRQARKVGQKLLNKKEKEAK